MKNQKSDYIKKCGIGMNCQKRNMKNSLGQQLFTTLVGGVDLEEWSIKLRQT